MLEGARKNIADAEILRAEAAAAFAVTMERDQATSTIAAIGALALPEFLNASSTDTGVQLPAATSTPVTAVTTSTAQTVATSSAEAVTADAEETTPAAEPSIKDRIDESFENVREAYENFLQISRVVKQLIGL